MTTPFAPPSDDPAALIDLVTQQRDLYRQLKELSDQQATLIESGQTDNLLTLLSQRQRLVDSLTRINRDMVSRRQAMPDLQASLSPEQRVAMRSLMDEVDVLLRGIIEQDDRDRAQLQSAHQKVGAQLKQTHRSAAALSVYRGAVPAAGAPRFTDRKG